MTRRSQLTTALVAAMVVISMIGMAVPAGAASSTGPTDQVTEQVHTVQNGEDLYLLFGIEEEITEERIEEMLAQGSADSPSAMATQQDSVSDVIQYQDVGQVNIVEQGEAVSVAIGGGEATAIQDVDQRNANSQVGEASAENYDSSHVQTSFEDVGDVYVVMGNSDNPQFNGWGVAEDGETTVAQTAQASVSQAQAVNQANVKQGTVAFAFAENESDATAVQLTEQSNQNLQEGAAVATNVYAEDLDNDPNKSYHERHKKHDGVSADQSAEASVEQAQEIQQTNVYEMGGAVAIAVGENATATAVQMTEQSNLNEQIGTAEAINVMLDSPGMNVATASIDGGSSIVDQEVDAQGADQKDHDKKKDDNADLNQTAEASVTQYQSVEQANVQLNSTAVAIATNGSEAEAVQLTFQENINAQVASAEALNVYLGDLSKHDKSLEEKGLEEGQQIAGAVITETTTATVNGDAVEGTDTVAFDYDGQNEQLNDVDQYSTAEVAQVQNITQLNLESSTALAVAEDDGDASALQLTIQENENVQVTESNATTVNDGGIEDGEDGTDGDDGSDGTDGDDGSDGTDGDDGEDGTDGNSVEAQSSDDGDEEDDESMPGFGAAVALVAVLAAAMLARRG